MEFTVVNFHGDVVLTCWYLTGGLGSALQCVVIGLVPQAPSFLL